MVLIEGPADIVPASEVPADVRAAVTGDWIAAWIQVKAERMLSYASEGALPQEERTSAHAMPTGRSPEPSAAKEPGRDDYFGSPRDFPLSRPVRTECDGS